MEVVKFYRGERGNCNGHTLEEIMLWKDGALELDHDWVQWVFPSNEPSGMNIDAPIFTREESNIFILDKELQEKVKQSFIRFLGFLKFKMNNDKIEPVVELPEWLTVFNHNMFRVTRVLKSLRLTGLSKYSHAFYDALKPFKDKVSANTWNHWTKAVFSNLFSEFICTK